MKLARLNYSFTVAFNPLQRWPSLLHCKFKSFPRICVCGNWHYAAKGVDWDELVLNLHKHAVKIDRVNAFVPALVTHLQRSTIVLFICFQASTFFSSEGQGWIPASAEHIYTVKWLQLSAAYFADVQLLSLHRSSALWAVTSGMGEAVLYLVINLLMLSFLTFTPVFPPFTASSIDYQLTVINIYWTATLLHSSQVCIQPKLWRSWAGPGHYVGLVKPVSQALSPTHLCLWNACQKDSSPFLILSPLCCFKAIWHIYEHWLFPCN